MPFSLAFMRRGPWQHSTGMSALISWSAVVVEDVSTSGGRVRIPDQKWPCRSYDGNLIIPAGNNAGIIEIDGATALVSPGSES